MGSFKVFKSVMIKILKAVMVAIANVALKLAMFAQECLHNVLNLQLILKNHSIY